MDADLKNMSISKILIMDSTFFIDTREAFFETVVIAISPSITVRYCSKGFEAPCKKEKRIF